MSHANKWQIFRVPFVLYVFYINSTKKKSSILFLGGCLSVYATMTVYQKCIGTQYNIQVTS